MINEAQRILRTNRIGSSDAPAICGISPYRTPFDVWARMMGKVSEFKGNAATEVGTYMERGVTDWLEKQIDLPLQRDVFLEASDGIRAANLDGICHRDRVTIAEIKTTSVLFKSSIADEYGDEFEGVDGVPQSVIVQTHHQAGIVSDSGVPLDQIEIVVGVLIGYRGFVKYRFKPDAELVEAVKEKTTKFFVDHVKTKRQPDGWPSADVARSLPRVGGKSLPVPAELVIDWQRLNQIKLDAVKAADEAKLKVIAAMIDAEVGESDAGRVTYKVQKRAGYTVEPTEFRVLRFNSASKK